MSADAVDITMEEMVNQYRDEVVALINTKMMLQAAVKVLGEHKAQLQQQVEQLSADLQAAMIANQPFDQDSEAEATIPP